LIFLKEEIFMKTFYTLLLGLLTLTSSLFAKEVDIKILASSDVHGRISPWNYSTDTENYSGGFSQISTLVADYRDENNNVILVDLGDAIQDNSIEKFNDIYFRENSHPVMKIYNEIGYDFIVPGNHEFNFGMEFLDKAYSQYNGEVLATNIYTDKGKHYYTPSAIIIKDGIKIGIIGATTPMTEKFEEDTDHLEKVEFREIVSEIKKEVKNLKKQGVDAIILAGHMGIENENNIPNTGLSDIAKEIPEIDLMLGGHAHKEASEVVVNGTPITMPYKYGGAVSVATLKFDVNKKGAELTSKETKTVSVKGVKSDKAVEKLYERFHNKLREEANVVVGETRVDLVPSNEFKGIPAIHTVDSGLSTLFGEVGFHFADADVIALSVDQDKARLDKGPIKVKDINFNYRYTGGDITVYEVTGRDLKNYLEWSAGYFNTLKDGDLILSFDLDRRSEKYATFDFAKGVTYDIDIREEAGNRIKNLTLYNGSSVEDDTIVKLGMNSYRMDRMLGVGGALEGSTTVKKLWASKEAYGVQDGTIRYMTMKYIRDVKNGLIEGRVRNNWKIIGLPESEDAELAKKLLNEGKIQLHNQGRATNIKSINMADIKKFK